MDKCVSNSKREYNSIDLAKFICAIMVVAIHVAPFGKTETGSILSLMNYGIQNYVSRVAVPFFFVCSGFFLFRKTTPDGFSVEPIKNYALRMLRLYVIWSIIYAPLKIIAVLNDPEGIVHGVLTYCRDIVFTGSYTHLWYFPALIFAVLMIAFLLQKK